MDEIIKIICNDKNIKSAIFMANGVVKLEFYK